jgi:uncharacterized protein (TIRG00374 family)
MKKLKNIPGLLISLLLLILLFYQVDLLRFASVFMKIDVVFAAVVLGLVFFGCYLRAVRWHYLLAPVKSIKAGDLFPAVIVGYMGNNLFPLRAGEFIRAHFIGRQQNISRAAAFSTIIMERLADGLSVLLVLMPILFLLKVKMQQALIAASLSALSLYLAVIAAVMLFHWRKQECSRLISWLVPKHFQHKVVSIIASLAEGFVSIKQAKQLALVGLYSLFIWFAAALSIQLMAMAFNFSISFSASLLILIILTFAVMLPSAPGFVGTFDAAMVYGLILFGVPKEASLGIAFFYHAINFIPIVLLGLYYTWKYNIGLTASDDK